MRVHIASDHAAYDLKNAFVRHLHDAGHDVVDHGPAEFEPDDDYPTYCVPCAEAVVADAGSLGVVLGGSGNGEQIAANDVRGARAALAWSEETARLARQHNDANVLSVGARMHTEEEATRFLDVFLSTPFSEDPRHVRRLSLLAAYERDGTLPPSGSAG